MYYGYYHLQIYFGLVDNKYHKNVLLIITVYFDLIISEIYLNCTIIQVILYC